MGEFSCSVEGAGAPEEGGLVGAVVEHLQELAAAQVEHELREHAEGLVEAEAARLVLLVLPELGGDAQQRAVQPPKHVERVLVVRLESRVARHQYRRRLLVKALHQVLAARAVRPPEPSCAGSCLSYTTASSWRPSSPATFGLQHHEHEARVPDNGGGLQPQADDAAAARPRRHRRLQGGPRPLQLCEGEGGQRLQERAVRSVTR
eukprot:1196005-Prorocentrum_minimum.AAC.4